jgi:hypothetical protein
VTVQNTVALSDILRVALPTDLVAGDVIVLEAWGTTLNNSGVAEVPSFSFGIGSTTITGAVGSWASNASNRSWYLRIDIIVSSSTLERVSASLISNSQGNGAAVWGGLGNVNNQLYKTVDMTENIAVAKDLFFQVQFTAAHANLRADRFGYVLYKIAA